MITQITTASPAKSMLAAIFSAFCRPAESSRDLINSRQQASQQQSPETMECGGFNEAFIVQHWASFGPRY